MKTPLDGALGWPVIKCMKYARCPIYLGWDPDICSILKTPFYLFFFFSLFLYLLFILLPFWTEHRMRDTTKSQYPLFLYSSKSGCHRRSVTHPLIGWRGFGGVHTQTWNFQLEVAVQLPDVGQHHLGTNLLLASLALRTPSYNLQRASRRSNHTSQYQHELHGRGSRGHHSPRRP